MYKSNTKTTKSNGSKRHSYAADKKITVIAKKNPFREGSSRNKSFAKLRSGATVAVCLKSGLKRGRLAYFARKGIVRVG